MMCRSVLCGTAVWISSLCSYIVAAEQSADRLGHWMCDSFAAAEFRELSPGAKPIVLRDRRSIRMGRRIPDEGYCDQPYVVVTKEGDWLCTLTTGPGREGERGQHVVSTRSTDQGRTWSPLVDIEPSDGPEASWVVPLVTPSGRVYAFYTYNGDNQRMLNGKEVRVDTVGWFAYRYSDDSGRSWSKQRYRLPLRLTACDRTNDWKGAVQIFWGIDKPTVVNGDALFAFTKLGKYMLEQGEGWFFRSDNILEEPDVDQLHWQLLPDGDHGVRNDAFGSVQEEHNVVALDCGKLYCVYRTTLGYAACSYSSDQGHSWSVSELMTYSPGGKPIKTPRACPMIWRAQNGKFLFWFHNHSTQSYIGRNPVWITGGVERNGFIHWSQPEILLYDEDVKARMSYPDLIEQDGRYWVTETNKTIARVHEIDPALLEGMWQQSENRTVASDGLIANATRDDIRKKVVQLDRPIDLNESGGVTIETRVKFTELSPGQILADSRESQGHGFVLSTVRDNAVQVALSGTAGTVKWSSDRGLLRPGQRHHIAVVVDHAARVLSFIIDGVLCDGGKSRTYGWHRYATDVGQLGTSHSVRLAPTLQGEISVFRVYRRYLRTSEIVGNYHAGHSP